jgi:glucose dehydrogenase
MIRLVLLAALTASVMAQGTPAITPQDIAEGLKDPGRWLTYGGDYGSQRYSPLTQITPANVNRLVPQWTFQTGTTGAFQTTPLLIDGVLYVTGFNNNAWAVDARSGRQILALSPRHSFGLAQLLRRGEPRLCRARRSPLHDHHRRAPRGARHEDRQSPV